MNSRKKCSIYCNLFLALVVIVFLFSKSCFASSPAGNYLYFIEDIPVLDISGTYEDLYIPGQEGGAVIVGGLSLSTNAKGLVSGEAIAVLDSGATHVDLVAKGKAIGGQVSINLSNKFKEDTKVNLLFKGVVGNSGTILGSMKGIFNKEASDAAYTVEIDLPAGAGNGSWSLVLSDLQTDNSAKVTGSATVTLSTGRDSGFFVSGKYNAKKDEAVLKLIPSNDTTSLGKLSITLDCKTYASTNLKGKLLGTLVKSIQGNMYSKFDGLDVPRTESVEGNVTIPSESPLDIEGLTIRSISGSASLDSNGVFRGLEVIDEGSGQVLFIETSSGTLIATAYLSPEQVAGGYVSIDVTEMALGLIKTNPYIMILSPEKQQEVLQEAQSHADFDSLKSDIENALINRPELALDYQSFPYIYQKAVRIGIESITSLSGADSLRAAYENLGINPILAAAGGDPHLEDKTGPAVTIVNPKMTFYGVRANELDNLIRGRGKAFKFWPPWKPRLTSPHTKDWNLGDGIFDVTFYKGFNWGSEDWLNYTHAAGKATYANFTKTLFIVLDIVGVPYVGILGDSSIEGLMLQDDAPLIDFTDIAIELNANGWKKAVFEALPKWMAKPENWDKVRRWLWKSTAGWTDDSDNVTRYLRQAGAVWDGVQSALGIVGLVLQVGDLVNEWIPFFFDLVSAPAIIEYEYQQVNGVLTDVVSHIPPTAVFTVDDGNPLIDQMVTFDASASYDDHDSEALLQVRWDFNGDQVWDTGWNYYKTASYAYDQRGSFRARLEVKDSDGLSSVVSREIIVGSLDSPYLVVLTWGENPSDLDSHLFTPQINGSTYHVYFANKGSAASAPYAWLERDDEDSYGPETVWLEEFFPGTYMYSVYLFAGEGSLATSDAHVEVIDSTGVVASFDVPTTGSGRWWHVFELDGSTRYINPINIISEFSGPSGISSMIGSSSETMPSKD